MTSTDVTEHGQARTRRRRGRLAVALAALLVATLAPAPAHAADGISISGRVTDGSNAPIPGLTVTVYPDGGGQGQRATTRNDGTYTVTDVPPGTKELSVDDDWASGQDLWRAQYWNGTSGVERSATFTTGSSSLTGVDFRLRPSSGIRGRAVDQAGKPLQNVHWNVYQRDAGSGGWLGVQAGPLLTDAKGYFWYPLDPGTTARVCFSDTYYETEEQGRWTPTTRHTSGCWNAAGKPGVEVAKADDITVTSVGQRRSVTLTLPYAGKAMTPGTPYLTGATTTGTTLRVDPGAWKQSGLTFSYRWRAYAFNGADLGTVATSRTFTPSATLKNRYLQAEVTATRSGYAPTTASAWTGTVGVTAPSVGSALTITGTAAPGRTLTASHGTLKPSSAEVSLAWYAGSEYAGSGTTFTVTSAHRTTTISVRATYGTGGWDARGERYQQASVRVPGLAFTAGKPTISGKAVVGTRLTAKTGSWSPTPTTYTYRWLRDGKAISGATTSSYTLTKADRGKRIQVTVTGTRSGYDAASRTSATTAAVKGVLTSAKPKIVGTASVGKTLTVRPGTWKPSPVSLTYRWYRNGKAISGATKSTYRLTSADRGKRITVRVTGKKSGYVTASRTSAKTSTIR